MFPPWSTLLQYCYYNKVLRYCCNTVRRYYYYTTVLGYYNRHLDYRATPDVLRTSRRYWRSTSEHKEPPPPPSWVTASQNVTAVSNRLRPRLLLNTTLVHSYIQHRHIKCMKSDSWRCVSIRMDEFTASRHGVFAIKKYSEELKLATYN